MEFNWNELVLNLVRNLILLELLHTCEWVYIYATNPYLHRPWLDATSLSWAPITTTKGENAMRYIITCKFF